MATRHRFRLLVLAALSVVSCGMAEWQGTAPPVVPREAACGSGAVAAAGATTIDRRPYLQSPTPTGVTVVWAGNPNDAARVVVSAEEDKSRSVITTVTGRYAGRPDAERARRLALEEEIADYDDSDKGDGAADDDVEDATDEARAPFDSGVDADELYTLSADVVGLSAGEAHCYRIESNRGVLTEWASLTLAPRADDSRVDRVVVLGDTGNGSPAQLAIARRLMNVPMDAILFVGDIAYDSGTHEQLQTRFFDVYKDLFAHVPMYAAIGNHDNRSDRGRPFEDVFVFPGNERWYSFDLGDVHFVVLDTTQIGRTQARWLDQDLASTSRRFTVVLGHHPPFTAARRGPSTGFRQWFVPILERHRVELVITGHEHQYERTRAINGIRYIVSGGGGGRLVRAGRNADTEVALALHHFLTLAIERDAIKVTAIDIDGQAIDEIAVPDRN